MNTETGNKIIAEFMGYKYVKDGDTFYNEQNMYFSEQLKYHTSWDWLMPVVEKIEVSYEVSINDTFCEIVKNDGEGNCIGLIKKDSDTKIEAVWLAVLEFINWYNNQKVK